MPYLAIIQIQIKAKGIVEYVDPSIILRDNSVIGFQHQDKTACSQLNQLSNLRSSPTDDVPANVVENERKISTTLNSGIDVLACVGSFTNNL